MMLRDVFSLFDLSKLTGAQVCPLSFQELIAAVAQVNSNVNVSSDKVDDDDSLPDAS